jgi:hypothetical protein
MRKIIIYCLILLTLSILLFLLFSKERSPFGKDNTSFAVDPQKEITKIELIQKGVKVVLAKENNGWTVNGTEARKSGVLFILRILQEIKIKSPVSPDLFKSEIEAKGIEPVKVRVYSNRKLLKSYLVFKTGSNTYGEIIKMKDGSKPYIAFVPGIENNIGSAFTLKELFWKPYTVFNLMPSEISEIKFENFSDTSSSFSISRRNSKLVLTDTKNLVNGSDSALIARYLSYFIRVQFESWIFETESDLNKSIRVDSPKYKLTVNTITGKNTELTLWEKTKTENGKENIDTDRLYGKTRNDSEYFIIRYFDVDPILKKRSYFFRH